MKRKQEIFGWDYNESLVIMEIINYAEVKYGLQGYIDHKDFWEKCLDKIKNNEEIIGYDVDKKGDTLKVYLLTEEYEATVIYKVKYD